jgi:hypothetical protein
LRAKRSIPWRSNSPFRRRLRRRDFFHPFEDVFVQLVQTDVAVLVPVGPATPQPFDQRPREHRRPTGLVVGEARPLERVLGGAGRRDHHPPTPAQRPGVEPRADVDLVVRPRHDTALERATEATVQEQHHPVRAAASHQPVHHRRVDGRGDEPLGVGVRRRQVQLARRVRDPVAGEVEQDEVVGPAGREHVLDPLAHLARRRIGEHLDVEPTDIGVAEHLGKRPRVDRRRGQPTESGIPVGVHRHDERGPPTIHDQVIQSAHQRRRDDDSV